MIHIPEFDKQVTRAWSACRAKGLVGDAHDVSIHLLRYGVDAGPIAVAMKLADLRLRRYLPLDGVAVPA